MDDEKSLERLGRSLLGLINRHSGLQSLPIAFGDGQELTPREAHVIQAVGDAPGINIRDLGAGFLITKSAASQMVSRLARRGLVRKDPSPRSNKELQLFLTDLGWAGYKAHQARHKRHDDILIRRMARFSSLEIDTAARVLEAVEDAVDETWGQEINPEKTDPEKTGR